MSINYQNNITVKDTNGKIISQTTATVTHPQGPSGGVTMMPGGQSLRDMYAGANITFNGRDSSGQGHTTIIVAARPVVSDNFIDSSGFHFTPTPAPPRIPERPTLEVFSKPRPLFESGLERHTRFAYFFGLDRTAFKTKDVNMTCGRITKDIFIGNSNLIELESIYRAGEQSSVEFSIIDNDKEYPIIPIHDKQVKNEKIFFEMPLRFGIDKNKPFEIKRNGAVINISVEQAINSNDGNYTVSYFPANGYSHVPTKNVVRVKIVLRIYDKTAEPPYVVNVSLRGYGGKALWIDRT